MVVGVLSGQPVTHRLQHLPIVRERFGAGERQHTGIGIVVRRVRVPPVSAARWSPGRKPSVITTDAHASVAPSAPDTVSAGESGVSTRSLVNSAVDATPNTGLNWTG